AKTRASGTGRRSSRIQAQPRPQRRRRIDNASVATCRKPSRLASAIADGVAPFRDFPVRRSSCAPLAAASLTRHRPVQKSAAVGTPAARNWFLRRAEPRLKDLSFRLSAVLREALVCFSHGLLAIGALEAANGEVTSRHLLEMLDERVVHGSAAERTDEGDGLSRELLRDHQTETGCDLGDEAHENWAAFLDDAALDDESRGLRYAFRQYAAHGKISALGSIGRTGTSAQREYLHARERRFRIGQIFAFAARNFRNRPQHDDGRE